MPAIDERREPGTCVSFLAFAMLLAFSTSARADDAETSKLLRAKGAEVTETKGVVTSVSVRDGAKLAGLKEFRTWHAGGTDEGVKKLKELKNLKSLYLGQRLTYKLPACPTDETIGILVAMKSLESLQLDEARLTFVALKQLKQ